MALTPLAKLAARFPEICIVVDHLGGKTDPDLSAREVATWRAQIDQIARYPNVVVKLGGALQRERDWLPPFHNDRCPEPASSEVLCEQLFPFFQYVIDAFGPDRCMFESNFPVDRECVSYRTLWNLFKRIARRAGLSDDERQAVFSGTAARVYRLPDVGSE